MAATTQVRLLVWSLTNLPRTDFCFPLAPIARSERDATKRTARANNRYSAKRCSPKPSRLGRNSHANPRTLPNGKPKDATAIAGNEATIATAQALREKLGCLASSRYAISQNVELIKPTTTRSDYKAPHWTKKTTRATDLTTGSEAPARVAQG